ncbi:MAG: hypothetical protein FWF24_01160 [Alphaproteobacteria bacterium]|nr:hypothetical protein [Alphaproteobacteria bacterium]
MIDTYLKAGDKEALLALQGFLTNVTLPQQGRAAGEEEGQTAAGDPVYWYVCVRFLAAIAPFGTIEACTPQEGKAVCGVWT